MDLSDIRDAENLENKYVLVRADLNVPIARGRVENDFRIRKSLDTVIHLKERGARVILISHLSDESASLKPVAENLSSHLSIKFIETTKEDDIQDKIENTGSEDVILLENMRRHVGEKTNDPLFSKFLASLGSIYVNDAFSASHRNHASIIGVPKLLPHYAGILFQREVKELSYALSPQSPSLFILGGAKFETKEPLVRKLLQQYDHVFIGGALAHDFFKAQGLNIGQSLVSEHSNVSDLLDHEKITLPTDVTVKRGDQVLIIDVENIADSDVIVDQGPKSISTLRALIEDTSFILWNGPFGNYENGFSTQTEELAKIIAESDAKTIVGGGDTVASIAKLNLEDKFTFVSTGGGAMIVFLSNGTLPGIEALVAL